jgi:defect in organelle trafficking protein DotA
MVSVQQAAGVLTEPAATACTPITQQVQVGKRKGVGQPIYETRIVGYDPPGCNTPPPPPPPPTYSAPMPNFSDAPYSSLNGICGMIKWRPVQAATGSLLSNLNLNKDESQTVQLSRAIAIQQMYVDLVAVAQAMVNNSPTLEPKPQSDAQPAILNLAWTPLGGPLDQSGGECTDAKACTRWGVASGTTNANALFSGGEFYGALADYRAVMTPSQRLLQQGENLTEAKASRAFIQQANAEGWLMAGSYFFRLARLNQTAINAGTAAEKDTGLDNSVSVGEQLDNITPSAKESCSPVDYDCICADSSHPEVCQWLQGKSSYIKAVQALISGEGVEGITGAAPAPNFTGAVEGLVPLYGPRASTVGGYINNALIFGSKTAAQPGQAQIPFQMLPPIDMNPSWLKFNFNPPGLNCGGFLTDASCNIKAGLQWFLVDFLFKTILTFLLDMIAGIVNQLFILALWVPLKAVADEFISTTAILQLPNVNPVIALANMGVEYINYGMEHFIKVMTLAMVVGATGWFAPAILFFLMMVGPILGTWIGVMMTIGFSTAYYVPLIPYMVFTFGSIAWLTAVLEAMVAAPIVALGVSSPEGDQAFGKGEQAIMLLMNVFLRPAMMVIGYIAGIMMSYVGVWILMTGFSNALAFIQGGTNGVGYNGTWGAGDQNNRIPIQNEEFIVDTGTAFRSQPQQGQGMGVGGMLEGMIEDFVCRNGETEDCKTYRESIRNSSRYQQIGQTGSTINYQPSASGGYPGWAGAFSVFFMVLIFTTMYITIVQEAFNLIATLPDKILRWIGGTPETLGQDSQRLAADVGKKVEGAGQDVGGAGAKMGGDATEQLAKKVADDKKGGGHTIS